MEVNKMSDQITLDNGAIEVVFGTPENHELTGVRTEGDIANILGIGVLEAASLEEAFPSAEQDLASHDPNLPNGMTPDEYYGEQGQYANL